MGTEHDAIDLRQALGEGPVSPGGHSFARPAPAAELTAGWVRLIREDGRPVAIRSTAVMQVEGPFPSGDDWRAQVTTLDETITVAFETDRAALAFVDDLLHD